MYDVLGDHGVGAGREAVSFIGKEYSFLSQNNDRSLTEDSSCDSPRLFPPRQLSQETGGIITKY